MTNFDHFLYTPQFAFFAEVAVSAEKTGHRISHEKGVSPCSC